MQGTQSPISYDTKITLQSKDLANITQERFKLNNWSFPVLK